MRLSELIKEASELLEKDGDLDVLDEDMFGIMGFRLTVSEGEYPEDYDLPTGEKFVQVVSMK